MPHNIDLSALLPLAIHAAEEAVKEILHVYNSGNFQAEVKGDNSPLTLADRRANEKISAILRVTDLPILSEEGKNIPYEVRKNWDRFWMVDPLDGTKEFIKKNGEFTVNIALIETQRPVLGVVSVPVSGETFYAAKGHGVWLKREDYTAPISPPAKVNLSREGLRVVASRSHVTQETEQFVASLTAPLLVSQGSSLKFMLLVKGEADVYPRFAPTMEWDTAAAHAICNEVGIAVFQKDSQQELIYNKPDLLNPSFLAWKFS